MNNDNNNNLNNQTTPKRKFFTQSVLNNNVDINNVGGTTTTNNVSNNVISWDVGKKKHQDNSTLNVSLNDVNATVVEPEVLDLEEPSTTKVTKEIAAPKPEVTAPKPVDGLSMYNNYSDDSFLGSVTNTNPVTMPVYSNNALENSPIFQAANEKPEDPEKLAEIQNQHEQFVESQMNNESWMQNQPLSSSNIENSKAVYNNVESADKREKKNKKKEEIVVEPVPEELLKKEELPIRKDLLVNAYIGDDYQKYTMSPFNFGALIFGAFHFGYLKMLILGFILVIGYFIIIFRVPFEYVIVALIAYHLVLALIVNRIFILSAKIKVALILKTNRKKKQEQLENKCRHAGRPSIIFFLLLIVLFVLIFNNLCTNKYKDTKVASLYQKVLNNKSTSIITKNTSPIIYDNSFNVEEYLEIKINDNFSRIGDSGFRYSYKINDNTTCSFNISGITTNNNAKDFLDNTKNYNEALPNVKEVSSLLEENINNILWYKLNITYNNMYVYYASTNINDEVVLLEYDIDGEESNDCLNYYNELLSNITLKEE